MNYINCAQFGQKMKKKLLIYLGKPYSTRIAVTSHRRASLHGPVEMSIILFPGPIIGRLNICIVLCY
jgi:hypothetical protein